MTRIIQLMKQYWRPVEIAKPEVDSDLEHLDGVQRSAEVLRYSILSLEFWLSPKGQLRAWLRLNGIGSAVLLIPALIITPLIGLILWQLLGWMVMLVGLAGNLIVFPIAALIAVGVIKGVIMLLKALFR